MAARLSLDPGAPPPARLGPGTEAKVKMKRALMFVVLGIAVIGEAANTADVPSITFLTGSGPEVLRQAGPGAASLDLGRIAFYERMTAPAARMNNRTEATGRFR